MSAVWNYFNIVRNAFCKHYSAEISRGGSSNKHFNTANLIVLLKQREWSIKVSLKNKCVPTKKAADCQMMLVCQ